MEDDKYWIDEWNQLHIQYVKEERENKIDNYRNDKMADYCEEIIIKAKKAYYDGNPIMTDSKFDRFEEYLKLLRPNSKILEKVGS